MLLQCENLVFKLLFFQLNVLTLVITIYLYSLKTPYIVELQVNVYDFHYFSNITEQFGRKLDAWISMVLI